jgi:hypothetical protein
MAAITIKKHAQKQLERQSLFKLAVILQRSPEGVPWQRVVNAQGKISLKPGKGAEQQRKLLEDEGVIFDERDRIDLEVYGWSGEETRGLEEPSQPSNPIA